MTQGESESKKAVGNTIKPKTWHLALVAWGSFIEAMNSVSLTNKWIVNLQTWDASRKCRSQRVAINAITASMPEEKEVKLSAHQTVLIPPKGVCETLVRSRT